MMKNRTGWVALLVLGVATLLMVFFVLPRISETGKEAEKPTTTAADTAKDTAAKAETTLAEAGKAAAEKMDRLKADAATAVSGLSSLFADGKTPAVEAFTSAKTAAQSALSALSALEIPQLPDTTAIDTLKSARDNAAKALALLEALPQDPSAASTLLGPIEHALKGTTPPAAPATEAPAAATPAAPADESASTLPRFDVLRVEPDGSTVIAGSAEPGAKLDIVSGDKTVTSVQVEPNGDFVAVLDQPLPPGDHVLALRVTGKDGKTATSEEMATVSVPTSSDGKLLAMVTKPGEASRLITLPETVNSDAKQSRVAAETATAATNDAAAPAPATPATPAVKAEIQVSAVEIEGKRIFVAGEAPAGSTVRALADETRIGEIKTDATGHFVVEGTIDLPVGSHVITVELLDENGNVKVKASVPFDRPAGDQVSVVAQASGDAAGLVPLEQVAFEKQRDALSKAFAILKRLYADGKSPAIEELAAARSATEIGLQSIADFRLPSSTGQALIDFITQATSGAKTALSALRAVPAADVKAMGTALPKLASLIDAILAPAAPAPTVAIQDQSPSTDSAFGTTETATAEPKTITQAPLQESRNSVIIRRGDTLWQISRRVYGQGVRYTTIYLANAGQIANPDKIEPGQIFSVPNEALPNAEELHRKRLHGEKLN
ncbi:peptidoglycan-binding protein [Rhizobium sp. ACO-34A]|nr:LysM peptidoglycan-binding domain-containing protein [Rhizobium sp. ACO-34A]ATN33738.1 peptidoglycan-binding protein [Rhizobium sp. ACO-34A]